jgi:hypothetical protein
MRLLPMVLFSMLAHPACPESRRDPRENLSPSRPPSRCSVPFWNCPRVRPYHGRPSLLQPRTSNLQPRTSNLQPLSHPHPSPLFRKDVIAKDLLGGVCKRFDSKGFTATKERIHSPAPPTQPLRRATLRPPHQPSHSALLLQTYSEAEATCSPTDLPLRYSRTAARFLASRADHTVLCAPESSSASTFCCTDQAEGINTCNSPTRSKNSLSAAVSEFCAGQ